MRQPNCRIIAEKEKEKKGQRRHRDQEMRSSFTGANAEEEGVDPYRARRKWSYLSRSV